MLPAVLVGLIAAAVALAATPLAAVAARRFDVMDHPDTFLKPHARPIPYLGGVAIALGWIAGLAVAVLIPQSLGLAPSIQAAGNAIAWFAGGGVVMMLLGLMDDTRDLSPKLRLALGAATVALLMWVTGTGLTLVATALGKLGLSMPPTLALALALPLGIVIVLGACNSTNLIDGLDGLCAGVLAITAAGFALLLYAAALRHPQAALLPAGMVLAAATSGAALGFLPHNFNPARIFMGDAGSLLLGYACGVLMLVLAATGELRWFLGGLMLFGMPIYDTALAIFRRWCSGRPIFQGDRSHFYDQLVQRGLSVRATAITCYLVAALFVAAGLSVAWLSETGALVLFAAVVAATMALSSVAGFAKRAA